MTVSLMDYLILPVIIILFEVIGIQLYEMVFVYLYIVCRACGM